MADPWGEGDGGDRPPKWLRSCVVLKTTLLGLCNSPLPPKNTTLHVDPPLACGYMRYLYSLQVPRREDTGVNSLDMSLFT